MSKYGDKLDELVVLAHGKRCPCCPLNEDYRDVLQELALQCYNIGYRKGIKK